LKLWQIQFEGEIKQKKDSFFIERWRDRRKSVYICTTISGNGLQEQMIGVHSMIKRLRGRKRVLKKRKKVLEERKNGLPLPNFRQKKLGRK
jgi:hypothetical protein